MLGAVVPHPTAHWELQSLTPQHTGSCSPSPHSTLGAAVPPPTAGCRDPTPGPLLSPQGRATLCQDAHREIAVHVPEGWGRKKWGRDEPHRPEESPLAWGRVKSKGRADLQGCGPQGDMQLPAPLPPEAPGVSSHFPASLVRGQTSTSAMLWVWLCIRIRLKWKTKTTKMEDKDNEDGR